MLFGDADIEVAVGKLTRESHEARSLTHRGCDHNELRIVMRHLAQPVAEDLCVGGRWIDGRGADETLRGIEGCHAVIFDRLLFGALIACAFAGQNMQQLWAATCLEALHLLHEARDVVTINRATVFEAERLEEGAGCRDTFGGDVAEVAGEGSHVFRDRHPVVVENDDQIFAETAGMM